jgi:hypothetical protein
MADKADDIAMQQQARLEARYANAFQVGHNAFEFVLEFSQQYGDTEDAAVHTRIVTSPHYAKGFCAALETAIADYEREFGVIKDGAGS